MDDFGFKDPSSTCAHALHFFLILLLNLLALSSWKVRFCTLQTKAYNNKSPHTTAWSNSLVTTCTARGTSRTYGDESEWSNKLVPTNHPCGKTCKLKKRLIERPESSFITLYRKYVNFESISPLLPASRRFFWMSLKG